MANSASFVHVLATRVGLGIYDQAWFDYRLRLFESITVPSMAAQTSHDFMWLLVIDRDMPPKAREDLDHATGALHNAAVVPVEFKTDFKRAVAGWSQERAAAEGAEFVMTSRLDDDDALRIDALERVQSEAADLLKAGRHRRAVFSLNLGCMWIPSQRVGFTRYHDSHSLGLSLVEPAEVCQGVYSRPHRQMKQLQAPRGAYIRGLDGDTRWWLYATHDLADSERGDRIRINKILNHRHRYRVDDSLLASFGLDPETVDDLGRMKEPATGRPTKFLSLRAMEAEKEIKKVRSRLAGTPKVHGLKRHLMRLRIRRLEEERRKAGSGIIAHR